MCTATKKVARDCIDDKKKNDYVEKRNGETRKRLHKQIPN